MKMSDCFDKEIILKNATYIDKNQFNNSIIYFLLKNDEVVYVGQTNNLLQRLSRHVISKDFDKYSWFLVSSENLNEIEADLIIKFKPKFNKNIPTQNKYWSYDKIRITYGLYKKDAQKVIGSECVSCNGMIYVEMTSDKHEALQKAGEKNEQ